VQKRWVSFDSKQKIVKRIDSRKFLWKQNKKFEAKESYFVPFKAKKVLFFIVEAKQNT
jgi:hypothetical protein